jgi:hypothetical protein
MATLFGFEIKRKQDDARQDLPAFSPPIEDDGAMVVAAGGVYGTYVDLDGAVRSEAELVTKYREMALTPEVDAAVDEITNEAIVDNGLEPVVKIDLSDTKLSEPIKKKINEEFNTILDLLDFSFQSYDIFRKWYIDGRLNYHVIIDNKNPRAGIQELRYIDPRKIRKVREIRKKPDQKNEVNLVSTAKEYYIYNDKGFNKQAAATASGTSTTSGVKIAKDSIVFVPSGLMDKNNTLVLSYIHKAIKPLNQLRTLEDATVIYRISRAPERRIFYIDVGNLPKMKAEQYLRDMMIRHKNKVVYDSSTGEVRDDRKFLTMLEDYWFPRRDGTRGTEVQTLPAGQNLGEMADVEYFQKKLYESLNVPVSRLDSQNMFNVGRSAEITREEIKFFKQTQRLRLRFSQLFSKALERQLLLKGVLTSEDWSEIVSRIKYTFTEDNHYAELRDSEILKERMELLQTMQGTNTIGMYYSHKWVRENVLKQTEDDIEEMNEEIQDEKGDEFYNPPVEQQGDAGVEQQGGENPEDNTQQAPQSQPSENSNDEQALKQYFQ